MHLVYGLVYLVFCIWSGCLIALMVYGRYICSLVDVWSVMFVDILIVLFCVLCDIYDYDRIRWLDYKMIVDIKW